MDRRKLTRAIALGITFAVSAVLVTPGAAPGSATASSRLLNRHSEAITEPVKGGEASRADGAATPEEEQYDSRAFPAADVLPAQREQAKADHDNVDQRGQGKAGGWVELGPITPNVSALATYTGRPTMNSGRVSSLAVAPGCAAARCAVYVGAAGGGVWVTSNALAGTPTWRSSSRGIPSNAIGSLTIDPNDPSGRTLYAGTGEANGSSDSEAGVGLYRSTDGGNTWSVVAGSVSVARDRAIGAIAVDPTNARHLFIGTNVARHGSASVNGGRFTPPGAPHVGLYESTDAGATWQIVLNLPADSVNPGSPHGSDFFKGGVPQIQLDPRDPATVYATTFGYGVWRRSPRLDGNTAFHQIRLPNDPTDFFGERSAIAVTTKNGHTRLYVGNGSAPATLVRTDNADVAAAAIAWVELSSAVPGTPGYGSYNYCGGQCSYDMPIATPPGKPDELWIGGQMQYNEIFTATPPSNGRTIQRSTNAGASFTDMTNDTQNPPLGMHPDQHAIAFTPDGRVAFLGSDGGVVRTSGSYTDTSGDCDARGLAGADLIDCRMWLKAIPTKITSLNNGLATLQFQSVSINARDPRNDIMGGTQDNGTWGYTGRTRTWNESIGGDGGQSGIDVGNPNTRVHTYYGPFPDVNFSGMDPLGWDWIGDPLAAAPENASFYVPMINDPRTSGTWFIGLQRVWRTQDNGGDRAYLDLHCNEYTGDFAVTCGDWVKLGGPTLTGSAYGATKTGSYVVAIARAQSNANTLWTATRRGRVFISNNANGPAAAVTFTRIDTAVQPTRFVSGIAVDPADENHAYVSFSGYNAYTPTTPGHVFEVRFDPGTGTATWTDRSYDLGDQPITGIAYDDIGGELYVATDFGVDILQAGDTSWRAASSGLPPVAVYGLAINSGSRVLYAATHGRGIWRLDISGSSGGSN